MSRKWKILATLLSLCLLQGGGARAETDNPDGYRLSDPVVHGNLAIYFVHGTVARRAGAAHLAGGAGQEGHHGARDSARSTSFRSRTPATRRSSSSPAIS